LIRIYVMVFIIMLKQLNKMLMGQLKMNTVLLLINVQVALQVIFSKGFFYKEVAL